MIVDDKGTNDPFVEISYLKYKKSSVKKSDMVNSVKINFNFLTLLIFQVFNEHIVFEDVSFDINDVTSYPIFLLKVFDKNTVYKNQVIGFKYLSVKLFKFF